MFYPARDLRMMSFVWLVVIVLPLLGSVKASADPTPVPTSFLTMAWHRSAPTGAADMSRDGSMIAIAEGFRHVVLYSTATHAVLKELTVDLPERIAALCLTPDGKGMVLAGRYGAVVLASTANGHTIMVVPEHFMQGTALAVSSDGQYLVVGSAAQVTLWQLSNGRLCRRFAMPQAHDTKPPMFEPDFISAVAISPNGKRIAADSQRNVVIWNAENGSLVRQFVRAKTSEPDVVTDGLSGSTGDIPPVLFTPDGAGVISGKGATVKCWDLATGKQRWSRDCAAGVLTAMAFSPDRRLLAGGDGNGYVMLMVVQSGEILRQLRVGKQTLGQLSAVKRVAFSPDGSALLAATENQPATLWRVTDGQQAATFGQASIAAGCQAVSPDGKLLALGTWDENIILLNTENGEVARTFHAHDGHVRGVAFSPDGSLLASAGEDKQLILWDTKSWTMVRAYHLHSEAFISTLHFSRDGNTLYSTGMGAPVLAWRVSDLSPQHTYIPAHDTCWQAMTVSPDNTQLVTGWSETVKGQISKSYLAMLDTQTGAIMWKRAIGVSFFDFYESPMVFSPDGQLLAWSHEDGTVEVMRATDGKRVYTTKPSQAPTFGIHEDSPAFTPDGAHLLAADTNHSFSIYRTSTGALIETKAVFSEPCAILMDKDGGCYTIGFDGIAKWTMSGTDK